MCPTCLELNQQCFQHVWATTLNTGRWSTRPFPFFSSKTKTKQKTHHHHHHQQQKKKTEQNAHTQTKNKNKKKKHKSSTGGHNPSFLYALTASRNTLNIVGVQECHKRENGVSICHFRSCPIKGCNRKRNRKALDLVICHHLRSTKDTASKNRLQYVESQ